MKEEDLTKLINEAYEKSEKGESVFYSSKVAEEIISLRKIRIKNRKKV